MGDRAGDFEAAASDLDPRDRDAFYWLLGRAARRYTVDGAERVGSDADSVTPAILVERIRQARETRKFPWAPADEDAWRRGVLMYRVATEAITNWHDFWRSDAEVARRVEGFAMAWPADPDGVLRQLLHYLNAEVLAPRVVRKPRKMPDLDPATCVREGGGRATDLAIAGVCLLRAWGIPAVLVRAPLLNRAISGDAWIGVPGPDLWMRPADTAPLSDGYFSCHLTTGDALKAWTVQDEDTHEDLIPYAHAFSFYLRYNFLLLPATDSTPRTAGTARVRIEGLPEPAFLSAWSGTGWLEVAPGRRDGRVHDFGFCAARDVLYLPTTISETAQALPAGDPFVLHPDGLRGILRAGTTDLTWEWNPLPEHAGAEPRVWKAGRFERCPVVEENGKRVVVGCPTALYVLWKGSRAVGRPFTVDLDGTVREF
ncbi:MAG: hypothetical protein HYY18_23105 [Planctomycetes bacterium]|nr:hypothetical protein [Planctomycetota bacterium]